MRKAGERKERNRANLASFVNEDEFNRVVGGFCEGRDFCRYPGLVLVFKPDPGASAVDVLRHMERRGCSADRTVFVCVCSGASVKNSRSDVRSGRRISMPFLSRRLIARLLSTFICSCLIVYRPFSRLGGTNAFLALTVKELVFSVQETLAQQLEATVLHFWLGGLLGIAISVLGKYIATFPSPDSSAARAIPAIFLAATSFIGTYLSSTSRVALFISHLCKTFSAGLVKSRLPRLTLSTRIACFISIWMLTAEGKGTLVGRVFHDQAALAPAFSHSA